MGGDLTTTPSDLFFCCSNRHLHPFPFFLYFVAFLFSSCFLLASSDSAFPPGFLHLPSLLQVANSARGNMGIFPKRLIGPGGHHYSCLDRSATPGLWHAVGLHACWLPGWLLHGAQGLLGCEHGGRSRPLLVDAHQWLLFLGRL